MADLPCPKEWLSRIRPYRPGKPIEEVERELGIAGALKLASNENPLGPSPRAISAMQAAAARMHLYPEDTCFYLKRDLSAYLDVPEDWLILGNGSDEVLHYAGLAYLRPGDTAVMAYPSFVMYETDAYLNGAEPILVPLKDFRHDLKAMAQQVTPKTRILFIANPNNPTGTIVTREEVLELLNHLPPSVLVILDEAYFEYVEDPEYPNGIDLVRKGWPVLVLRTFSKAFALAGLRIGYGVARPEIIEALQRVRAPFNVNAMAQEAARAALADHAHLARTLEVNRLGKRYLYQEFHRLGLPFVPTEANFIFVDTLRDSRKVFNALLRKGVIVRTGDIFNAPTFIRVTIGTPEQNQRLIAALETVLSEEPPQINQQ